MVIKYNMHIYTMLVQELNTHFFKETFRYFQKHYMSTIEHGSYLL